LKVYVPILAMTHCDSAQIAGILVGAVFALAPTAWRSSGA
jgi:hypothetical protein